jgi:hypothetical protein
MTVTDIAKNVTDEIVKRVDQLFFDTAQLYGYSKQWLLDPLNSHRIQIYELRCPGHNSYRKLVCIDNEELFEIYSYADLDLGNNNYKIHTGYKLIKEVFSEDNI